MPYSEFSNLHLRNVNEIYEVARARTIQALRNKKFERRSKGAPGLLCGQLKPIYPELIEGRIDYQLYNLTFFYICPIEIKCDESIISSFTRRPKSSPSKLSLTSSNLRTHGRKSPVYLVNL